MSSSRQQRLAQRPHCRSPCSTQYRRRVRPHPFDLDQAGKPTRLRGDRYELWIYRQIRERLATGELYLQQQHPAPPLRRRPGGTGPQGRSDQRTSTFPGCANPPTPRVDALCDEYGSAMADVRPRSALGHTQASRIRPSNTMPLSWRKPRIDKDGEALQSSFYAKLPGTRRVQTSSASWTLRCGFLSALTPLQPRYAKKIVDEDSLMAMHSSPKP